MTHDRSDRVGALNRDFHLGLIRPAGQPVTLTILSRLHVLSERYVRKHLEPIAAATVRGRNIAACSAPGWRAMVKRWPR